MSHIVPNLDFVKLLPTQASLRNFLEMLRKVYRNLSLAFNGNIGFGDGTNFDNISGTWANTTAPAAPNTDFTITHNLGRVPVGYWVMQKDRACDVYTGSVAATATQLTLRATVASAVLRLFIVCFLLFFVSAAQAQTTTVTLQVTDLGGQAWNLGTWSVVLVSKAGAVPFGPPFNIPGSGPVPNQFQTGNFDATGTATMILTPNASIVPTQSQWRFTVCPQATSPCFDQAFIIAGATQSVSPTPPAISVSCGAQTKAYSDSEVLCQQGGFYYGLTLNQIRLCTSSVLPNTCLTWVGSAGTAAAGGIPIQTQVNNANIIAGTPCESFNNLTLGPENVDCDWHSKGPNPYVDITRFGARTCNVNVAPCASGITATTSSGSAIVTLSSVSTFINGDGVVIYGAGTANGLSTPAAPTITNVLAQMGTGTDLTVPGASGSTTKCYKIIARTTAGGYTPASPETCMTTGQASLGAVTVNLSSCSRSGVQVTCTASSATPLLVGGSVAEVYIGGSISDSSFRGWRATTSATDSTHFTFTDTAVNTGNGASTSSSNGTATFFVANHLSWTAVSNAWLYYIYGGASGAETLIGVSRPQNITGAITYTTWDDFSNLMGSYTFPSWIPTTPPSVGANNNLSTTILSGAGTTTITLNVNAGATVAGAGIRLDVGPAMIAAAAVAGRAGELYIPGDSTGNSYVVNNYCDLTPYALSVLQSGTLTLHETIAFAGNGLRYVGDRSTASGAAGGGGGVVWGSFPKIFVVEAVPGTYINSGNSVTFEGINVQSQVSNGVLETVMEGGFNSSFKDDNWTTATVTTDLMGFGLILRGNPAGGVSGTVMDKVTFASGVNSDGATHSAPFFCVLCGDVTIKNAYNVRSGYIFYGNSSGASIKIDQDHYNGGFTPLVSVGGATDGVTIGQPGQPIIMDTIGHPCVSSFFGNTYVNNNGCTPSGASFQSPSVTGTVSFDSNSNNINSSVTPSVFNNSLTTSTFAPISAITGAQEFIFNVTGPGGISVGYNNDSIFVQGPPPTAPTCSVSAGGSVAIGTWTFVLVPIWWNGQEGTKSLPSSGCTTSSGNQTITINWTTPPGNPKQLGIFASNGGGYVPCGQCVLFTPGTTSVVWSSGLGSGVLGNVSLSGPSMMLPANQGMAASAYLTSAPGGFASTSTASSLTANRSTTLPDVNGMTVVSSYLNNVYDNFNRANGGLGSNWTPSNGTLGVSSNTVVGTTGANTANIAAWTFTNYAPDQFAEGTIVTGIQAGVAVRVSTSANTSYVYDINGGNREIFKRVNGSGTQLTTVAGSFSVGDLIRLEIVGSSLTAYRNGVVDLTTSDGAITTGQPGVIVTNNGASALDNWSGGNLHPIAQLDTEQDWTQPQHFTQPVTIGPTNPLPGALAANTLYVPNLVVNGTPFGPVYTTISASTNANITTTTMATAGAAGNTYRFGFYFNETVAGTGCTTNTTVVVTLTYTDPNLGVVTNISLPSWTGTIVNNGNLGTLNQVLPTYARAKAGTTVSYSVAYTAGTCTTTPSYQVFPILEILN